MAIKKDSRIHPIAVNLAEEVKQKKFSRRQFLFVSMSLGVSLTTAKSLLGENVLGPIISSANAKTPKRGGVLRISQNLGEITDPAVYDWVKKANCSRMMCEQLVRLTPNMEFEPWLLESWEVSDDAKVWILHVRKGVMFNNGDELTADDVIFNIRRWLDPAVGSSNQTRFIALTEKFDSGKKDKDGNAKMMRKEKAGAVVKLDKYTVQLTCLVPDVTLAAGMTDYPTGIVHRKFTEMGGDLVKNPIGTGPFLLKDYQVGIKASFRRRPDGEYWNGDPYLDGADFFDFGDDPSAELAAFASGQIDLNYETGTDQVEVLSSLPELTINETDTANTGVARMNVTNKPFDNQKLRQALLKAIDNEKIVEIAVQGRGIAAENHHVWPKHSDYAKLEPFTRDVAAAKTLLAEAGYPDGVDVTLTCTNNPAWEADACQAIANQLKDINVRVTLDVRPGATYWDEWTTRAFSFTGWLQRPLGIQVLNLAYRSGVPWNETGHNNAEFDQILDQAGGITDAKERSKIMADLEQIMQDDAIIIQSVWRKIYNATSARVRDYFIHPAYEFQLDKIWLDT